MSSKIQDHRHCPVCGKPIPPDQKYCSTKCEAIDMKRNREAEFVRKLMYIAVIAAALMMFVSILFR